MDNALVSREIERITASVWEELIAFRRETHRNPELSMQESSTSKRVKDFLSVHGIESHYIKDEKGVYFFIEGMLPGNAVTIRADLDALPIKEETGLSFASENDGVMHACGHDMNTTIVLGAAVCLHALRAMVRGRILVLFQCAEETFQGAKQVIETGIMEGFSPKYQFAMHVNPGFDVGTIALRRGNALSAGAEIDVVVKGKGGHGGFPQLTNDPICIAAQIVTGLQTLAARRHHPSDPLVITIGSIHAGNARNVTPDEAVMQGIVRYFNTEFNETLPDMLSDFCKKTAEAYGAECIVKYRLRCPPLITGDEIFRYADAVLSNAFEAEKVLHIGQPVFGSEDFAFFSPYGQVMQVRIGSRSEDPQSSCALHTSRIVFSENAIKVGIRAATLLAISVNDQ